MANPPSLALTSFHQGFNGFPQINSVLIQPETGQLAYHWIPFFQALWQATQPNTVTVDSSNAPIDPTLGEAAYTANQPNLTIFANINAPLHIHLWENPSLGVTERIKDVSGNASTNNITIHPHGYTIDGQPQIVLNQDYAMVSLIFNGNEWSIS